MTSLLQQSYCNDHMYSLRFAVLQKLLRSTIDHVGALYLGVIFFEFGQPGNVAVVVDVIFVEATLPVVVLSIGVNFHWEESYRMKGKLFYNRLITTTAVTVGV